MDLPDEGELPTAPPDLPLVAAPGSDRSLTPRSLDFRAVVDALPRAVIVTDPLGRVVLWNRRAEALYGWLEAEVLGRVIGDVLVPVPSRPEADAILAGVAAGEPWRGDFTVLRRDGDAVRVFVVDSPVLDDDGTVVAVVGASEDVTDQRLLEQQARDLSEHLALALDAGELGTWRWDASTGETTWDEKLHGLFGLAPGSFAGTFDAYVALLHPDDAPAVIATVEQALEGRSRYKVDHRVIWPDGSVHWLQGRGQATVDASGAATGTMGCVADITDQVNAELERTRALAAELEVAERDRLSAKRLTFLGTIDNALAASSTRADIMANVTRAAVPTLGEWCSIYVLPHDGPTQRPDIEIAHTDPSMVSYVRDLQAQFPYDPNATTGAAAVIRTGQSELIADIDEEVLDAAAVTDEGRSIVQELALASSMVVPLAKRGRVIGAMQFVNSTSSRAYTPDDLVLAEAVANRIASALENRRLAEAQRLIASTLQASLLPDSLPEIPGAQCAIRYWAAGEVTTVGGDFYDLFEVDDHWAAVIGDVCGTGPLAASLTGLARHTIRAAAWSGAEPYQVLRQLNHAIRRSGRSTFCTALYCTLIAHPRGFTLTVTAGGHPLPIVCRADGTSETIGRPGTLLGATDNSVSTTVTTELRPGDALVLYTDGITDVRRPYNLTAQEMEALVRTAATAAPTAEDIATRIGDQVDARLPFTHRNDDIAIFVLQAADWVAFA